MQTMTDKQAEAYKKGFAAGYRAGTGREGFFTCPYVNDDLRETWDAGFNDGKKDANDEKLETIET